MGGQTHDYTLRLDGGARWLIDNTTVGKATSWTRSDDPNYHVFGMSSFSDLVLGATRNFTTIYADPGSSSSTTYYTSVDQVSCRLLTNVYTDNDTGSTLDVHFEFGNMYVRHGLVVTLTQNNGSWLWYRNRYGS